MAQITAPIIAITLVLLSVFVPIAFIPGISGTLFRQFAVTISVAMLISAINALTLSPALCALFLRHTGPKRGIMGRVAARHRPCARRLRGGGAAAAAASRCCRSLLVAAARRGIFGLARRRRPGSCRRRTRARSSSRCSCPTAPRSRARATLCEQVEDLIRPMPQVEDVLSIVGFSLLDGGNQSNAAFVVVRLKPFADRTAATDSVQAVIGHVFGAGQQIRSANVFPFNLPPIIGLSTTAASNTSWRSWRAGPGRMGSVVLGLVAAANQDPRLTRVFSTFTATNPSIYLDIDRDKAQALGLLDHRRVHRAAGDAGRLSTSTTSTCSAAPGR